MANCSWNDFDNNHKYHLANWELVSTPSVPKKESFSLFKKSTIFNFDQIFDKILIFMVHN
jgi:hypothetical protein